MNLVTLNGISKQYSERQLLNAVDLLINQGERIGLIGVNGSGKTTLLRMIAGQEQPDSGSVTVWGSVSVQFLAQQPDLDDSLTVLEQIFNSSSPQIQLLKRYEQVSEALSKRPSSVELQADLADISSEMERTGGWAAESKAKAILSRLGITQFGTRIGTLSGGERKRVALAQALIDRADLLILDEPTNHIDADTVAWLEDYLVSEPGALLMVTHDRYFLDRVANRIVEIDRRQLVGYPGNYSRYLALKAERDEKLAAAEEKRQAMLRRELAWLQRGAQARTTKQKARIERVTELQEIKYDRGDQTVMMSLAGRRLGKRVLEAKGISKSFGERTLFDHVSLTLAQGERIGLVGPNGAGKSTLLDILVGDQTADDGEVSWGETVKVGYYDQQSRAMTDESMKVVDFIDAVAPRIQAEDGRLIQAPQMLEWFLFPRPQQQAQIGSLSGGERRRLYLLRTLALRPNVLILDEPTNDLDIQTLNVLEQFLDHFKGCLLVVSHDRYFLDRTVDYIATFENGRLSARYPAPYSSFQAARKQADVTSKSPPKPTKAAPGKTHQSSRGRKLTFNETRELADIETQMPQLEAKKAELQAAINNIGEAYAELPALVAELEAVSEELDLVELRWLELTEIAEG